MGGLPELGLWIRIASRAGGRALALLVALALGSAAAEEAVVSPRHHSETTWNVKDGLPDNALNSVLQTRDHYLWIGTEKGLARFDGVRFRVFDTWNTKELHSERISSLCEDGQGNLWIGTKGGGVTRYRAGAFSHAGLSSQFVSALCADRGNRVWVGTSGGGVFAFNSGKFDSYSTSSGLPDLFITSMCAGRDGTIWIGTRSAGLVEYSGGQFLKAPLSIASPLSSINVIFEDETGLWLGTAGGLVQRAKDGVRTFTTRHGLPSDQVVALGSDRKGNLWVGTRAGAITFPLGGDGPAGKERFWMREEVISSCCVDVEGNTWLATASGGLKQLAPTRFGVISRQDGLSHEVASCVLEDHAGQLWFGTYGGLNRLSAGQLSQWGPADGLNNPIVTALLEDAQGGLWIGTQQGLNRMAGDRLLPCRRDEGWPQVSVWAFHQDGRGVIWMGTADGLYEVNLATNSPSGGASRVVRHSVDSGLPSNDIRALAEDRTGGLWIGTSHGLAFRKGGRLVPLTFPSGLLTRIILCLHVDSDGVVWCGTLGGGLIRLNNGMATAVTTKEGFPDSTIYRILDDGLGFLWLASNRGVFRVAKDDLSRLARHESQVVAPAVFGQADGLPSEECKGFSQPAGWRSRDGRLWFPTSKGVAVVDPARLRADRSAPSVVLEEAIADHENFSTAGPISLKSSRERVEFHYVALSFVMPERVRFRYILEGFDKEWTSAGGRRVAYYTRIPPGRYVFRVTACNHEGVWNDAGASVALIVRPEFWQTAWFRGGLLGTLALGILGIHRWRLARMRALERLRLQIARDLHDEVGSNLGSIVLLTQVAAQPASAELTDIRRVATATIDALRDIVWFINPAYDKLGDLVQRMAETARTMLSSVPYEFRQRPMPLDLELNVVYRQNLLPMFKEILNNAMQHARAKRLEVDVEVDGGWFRLRVHDDGVGFDEAGVKLGNGLRNLRRRATEMGALLSIESAPGRGTTVAIAVRIT